MQRRSPQEQAAEASGTRTAHRATYCELVLREIGAPAVLPLPSATAGWPLWQFVPLAAGCESSSEIPAAPRCSLPPSSNDFQVLASLSRSFLSTALASGHSLPEHKCRSRSQLFPASLFSASL